MSAPIDVESAGYETLRKWQDRADKMDRVEMYQAEARRTLRRTELSAELYALVVDLSGRSVESLSPELRLLVKRANALVARVEGIA